MRPDDSTLKQILSRAVTIPTGDNCQPWYFKRDDDRLLIFHNEVRAEHAINKGNHASLLSFGTLCEGLQLAARDEGLSVDIRLSFKDQLPPANEPWASVQWTEYRGEPDPISRGLELRATDRRCFEPGNLTSEVFHEIVEDGDDFPRIRLYLIENLPQELMSFLQYAETSVWTDRNAQQDLMKWIRFSDEETERTRDGMSWRTLGVSFTESRLLKLCRSFGFQQTLNHAGFLWQARQIIRKQIRACAGLLCWTADTPDLISLVEAGRWALRAWLRLNLAGYGVQPLTLSSLPFYDAKTGVGTIPPALKQRYERGLSALRETARPNDNQFGTPIWMLRTGRVEPLPSASRTLRLDIESILK